MSHKDGSTLLQDLKNRLREFCTARDWDQFHSPKELAIGLVTEASELLDLFRFKTDAQIKAMLNDPQQRTDISDELADTFFFVLRFAQMYNIDLSTALASKMEKNAQRYPVDKAKGSNAKYTELSK